MTDEEILEFVNRLLRRNKYNPSRPRPQIPTPVEDVHILDDKGALVQVHESSNRVTVEGPSTRFFNGKTRQPYHDELNIFPSEPHEQRIFDIENLDVPGRGRGLKREDVAGVPVEVPDYEAIFDRKRVGPGFLDADKGGEFYKPKPNVTFSKTRTMVNREAAISNPDVFFSREDFERGYITGDFANTFGVDPDKYVPFFFQDLRQNNRRVYFRAFLTSLRESIAPEWAKESYYGRVDPVPIYKNTSRTFQVGFMVAAFSPAGFSTMWKKINNLSKMLYPSYNSDGIMTKSPMIRLKIGDVLADGTGQGLPGYISSPLELDYSNMPWEINDFQGDSSPEAIQLGRAPMVASISFSFQVIHEKNPELDENYNFDTYNFRGIGLLDEDTENTSEQNPSTEVEDETLTDTSGGLED